LARLRLIVKLTTDIELARKAIASLAAEIERLDARLQYLTRDSQRHVTRNALTILRRAGAPKHGEVARLPNAPTLGWGSMARVGVRAGTGNVDNCAVELS
jgi:hypothetical protein